MEKLVLFSEDSVEVARPKRWTPTDPTWVEEEQKARAKVKSYRPLGGEPVAAIKTKSLVLDGNTPREVGEPERSRPVADEWTPPFRVPGGRDRLGLDFAHPGPVSLHLRDFRVLAGEGGPLSSRTVMERAADKLREAGFRQTPVLKEPPEPAGMGDLGFITLQPLGEGAGAGEQSREPSLVGFLRDLLSMVGRGAPGFGGDQQKILNTLLPVMLPAVLSDIRGGQKAMNRMYGSIGTTADGQDKFFQSLLPMLPQIISMVTKDYQPPSTAGGEQEKFFQALLPVLVPVIPELIRQVTKGYQPPQANGSVGEGSDKFLQFLLPMIMPTILNQIAR